MSATKILWGQIFVVSLIVLLTTWGATEYVAWKLGFQAQLGPPWFVLFGWPFYHPPAFFWWWFSYDAYARSIFQEGAIIAASGGFLSVAVAIFMSLLRAREADNIHTYGSARWASLEEVKAAELLDRGLHQRLDALRIGHVRQDRLGLAATGGDLVRHRVCLRLRASRMHHHGSARIGQVQRHQAADVAGCSGH